MSRWGSCVGENGRSRYRPVECPSVLGGNKGGTASFRPFMDEGFYFFMAFHGGFYTIRINILKKKQKQEESNHERVGKKF